MIIYKIVKVEAKEEEQISKFRLDSRNENTISILQCFKLCRQEQRFTLFVKLENPTNLRYVFNVVCKKHCAEHLRFTTVLLFVPFSGEVASSKIQFTITIMFISIEFLNIMNFLNSIKTLNA